VAGTLPYKPRNLKTKISHNCLEKAFHLVGYCNASHQAGCRQLTAGAEAGAPKPVLPAAPNVPAPNDGVAAGVPNRFVCCVVAVAPNKP